MPNKLLSSWMPVFAWCSLIFFLSNTPNLSTEFGVFDIVLRKLAHVTEFCVLFLLCRRAFKNSFEGWGANKVLIVSAIFSVLYAASDEFHQSFVPTRVPSMLDVGIDSAGVAAGYFIFGFLQKIKERKNAI